MKKLGAGSEIDAWCTRCRMDLGHRIIAMVGPQPKRVICQTCGSQHNYRPPRTITTPRGTQATPHRPTKEGGAPKPSARARSEHERLAQWESKIAGQALTAFTRYAMDRSFREGQLILHSKFGEGYVVGVLENGKVSIMFRDGPRTLAHRAG